jgi:predicted enzyme related to lactoylglutathione lyase
MEKVTGIGGVFFKAEDQQKLFDWYRDKLGIEITHGFSNFEWREKDDPETIGSTVWTPFKADTKYFEPSKKPFMINYRVRDLAKMLAQLRAAGCEVDPKIEDSEYGKFGWVMDPEGNRIELWEPPPSKAK